MYEPAVKNTGWQQRLNAPNKNKIIYFSGCLPVPFYQLPIYALLTL
jgi:hypothetical protein